MLSQEALTGLCDFDYIEIYDGPNASSTLIDRYCNENIPTIVSSTGGDITIRFHSDPFVEGSGFQIAWSCNGATGLNEINAISNIKTFINADSELELGLNNLVKGSYTLALFNSVGQVVVSERVNVNALKQTELINP